MNNWTIYNDDIFNKKRGYFFLIIVILLVMIMYILLISVKKEKNYVNAIEFIDSKSAYVFVDKNKLEDLKEQKKIYLNNISYDFYIDRIEEKDIVYLVAIHFPIEIDISVSKYQIILGYESFMDYIVRIIKGD